MIGSIATSAEVEFILVGGLAADLAGLAVEAFPVRLEHVLDLIGGELEAVRVEALGTQQARHEVSLSTKGAAKVAHLFEDKAWVVKRASYRIRVIAALIILSLVVLHHFLAILVFEYVLGDNVKGGVS